MQIIKPYIHKVICSSCGGISTLPLDILQTKILTNKNIEFTSKEFKYLFLMCNIFAFQNLIYDLNKYFYNNAIKGALSGLIISPFVTYIDMKKYHCRLKIKPNYKNFISISILREIVFYSLLYNLYFSNIKYIQILSPLITNIIAYPIKIYKLKKSYNIIINNKNIKLSILLEILKSSIGDCIALFLINNFKF